MIKTFSSFIYNFGPPHPHIPGFMEPHSSFRETQSMDGFFTKDLRVYIIGSP